MMWNSIRRTALAAASLALFIGTALATEPAAPLNAAPAFRPAAPSVTQVPLIGVEDCQDFAPNALAVVPGAGWMVRSGLVVLLKSYASKADAEHAKNIILHYGFTQQCFVGRRPGEMMYWKASGQIPKQKLAGEDCISFAAGQAFLSNAGGTWLVVVGGFPAARYVQTARHGAERAIQLIKAYKFTRMCQIVRPQGQMTYWLAE